ncbi:carboxy terminal-processing peptidase [Oceanobacter mangrovi]|uniref:carboxy terminal-processing peptidase n=1 Tax=Oceanobacter mangrovi TaxID=2862510 RepID=UPI001C8D68F9|nr:carboxy terminal-processing peptidase [Oceanobacter mangrovi]
MFSKCSKVLASTLLLTLSLMAPLQAAAQIPDVKPGTPFTPLEPTRVQAVTTQQILNNLLRGHYELQRLDDKLSEKVYDLYLQDMDSTRSYFLQSDINEFSASRDQLDDILLRGDLKVPFAMYNRFEERVNERLTFMLSELEHNAANYKFDSNERLNLDRENAPWAKSISELDDLWRKRLKNSILNLTMSGKDLDASLELLKKRYQNQLNRVHQSTPEDAFQTIMNSLTRSFDPHTQYFSPRNTENFNINMSLSLQGIGAVLQSEDEYTKVVRLVTAGPAEKAKNLHPADKIVGVGQGNSGEIVDVIGWRLDEVVDLIRGPKGSTVRLEIIPSDSNGGNSKVISIVRDEVKLEEQSAQKELLIINDGDKQHRIGVIDIPTFYVDFQGKMENRPDYKSTTRDVSRLIRELRTEGIEGLIIDLRNNGGGSLEEAISLTGLFIPQGPVVQVRSARGNVEVLPDEDPSLLYDGPMVVLVNRLSASASEIFAGAMQDYGRAVIAGGQTFGKGTVQSLRPLRHGQLKITQAKFYRVSGDSTQNQGVLPDVTFPSLFDKDKIGESALDEAMPWDTIRPAQYVKDQAIKSDIPMLQQLHEKRTENDPDFVYLREQKTLIDAMRKQTDVSLNRKIREEERDANESERLQLENKRRKAKGLPLMTLEEEKAEAEAENNGTADSKKDKPEDDALLTEAGRVLLDYVAIGQQQAAAR